MLRNRKLLSLLLALLCVVSLLSGCKEQSNYQSIFGDVTTQTGQSVTSTETEPTEILEQPSLPEQTDPLYQPEDEEPPRDTQSTTQPQQTTQPTETTVPAQTDPKPQNSSFAVHFIDVGQADAALVLCDGKAMLIDGGNTADSSLIYSYLKKNNISHLDYIVCTHAHEDHVGGLSGAVNYATVGTALCSVTSYSSNAFNNFVKNLRARGVSITVPKAGDSFKLGSATVKVLGPIKYSDDPNNMSLVLRIVYGNTSFLFTGDAERDEEQDILNAGYTLKSTVLKVGHHGSYTSSSYQFLRSVMPKYGVISVGKDNSYGHPHEDPLSRLRDADVKLYRTDMQGTIICTSNGSTVSFKVSKNANADTYDGLGPNSTQTTTPTTAPTQAPETMEPTQPEQESGTQYVLNTNSMKFHYPDCEAAAKISKWNRGEYTGDREDLLDQGYSPCGYCHP